MLAKFIVQKSARLNQNRPARKGAIAVEFAMTAPLLFLILFGCLELGHANMVFNVAEAAAYEGARKGIVPGANQNDVTSAAQRLLNVSKVRNASIRVTPSNLSTNTDTIRVAIEIPYRQNSIVFPTFTRNLVIERECVLTRETAD